MNTQFSNQIKTTLHGKINTFYILKKKLNTWVSQIKTLKVQHKLEKQTGHSYNYASHQQSFTGGGTDTEKRCTS